MQLFSFLKAYYILKKHYDSDRLEQRNQCLQSLPSLEHLLCFASPSDCNRSQNMKPSVMAHFQIFMDRSVAGHWIILREKAGLPQLFTVHKGSQWLQSRRGLAGLRRAGGGHALSLAECTWDFSSLGQWELVKGDPWWYSMASLFLSKSYRLKGTSGGCSAQASPLR